MEKRSFANGNAASHANGDSPDATGKQQRDSGWNIRPESSWTLTLGMLP